MVRWPGGGVRGRAFGPVRGVRGWPWGAVPVVLRLYLASKRAWCPDSLHPSLRRGRGCSRSQTGLTRGEDELGPVTAGARPRWSCGGGHLLARAAPPGGDAGVPGDAAGDDGVDLADQRRSDRGAGLLVSERVAG